MSLKQVLLSVINQDEGNLFDANEMLTTTNYISFPRHVASASPKAGRRLQTLQNVLDQAIKTMGDCELSNLKFGQLDL